LIQLDVIFGIFSKLEYVSHFVPNFCYGPQINLIFYVVLRVTQTSIHVIRGFKIKFGRKSEQNQS